MLMRRAVHTLCVISEYAILLAHYALQLLLLPTCLLEANTPSITHLSLGS
jgi:hypothetical protein